MHRPLKSTGYIYSQHEHEKDYLFYADGLGWIHSDPDFLIEKEEYFDYLIMYVVSGKMVVEQYGRKNTLVAGEMILISLFDQHKYYTDKNFLCEVLWIHFNGYGCDKLIANINNHQQLPVKINSAETIPNILKRCFFLATNKEPGTEFHMSLYIYELLIEVMHYVHIKNTYAVRPVKDIKLVRCVDQLIEENMSKPITLKIMSNYLQISPYHFSRLFKNITGKSPIQYVIDKKIEKSKYMLIYTNKPIASIASELGFAEQSHFSRTFKISVKVSPSRYRSQFPSI